MLKVISLGALLLIAVAWLSWVTWLTVFHLVVFRKYAKLFDNSIKAFDDVSQKFAAAFENNNFNDMEHYLALEKDLLEGQDDYLRALRAVRISQNVPPWQWRERLNADYLEETRAA